MNVNKIAFLLKLMVMVVCLGVFSHATAQNCHINCRMNVAEFQGKAVVLYNMNTGQQIGSTKIADSAFAFDIQVTEPFVGYMQTAALTFGGSNYFYFRFVAEPGVIYGDLVTDSLSGTPMNDQYYKFFQQYHRELGLMDKIAEQMEDVESMPAGEVMRLTQDYTQRWNALVESMAKMYEANKTNAVGALALEDYLGYDEVDYETVSKMLEGAAPVVTTYKRLEKKLTAMEKLSHTAVGKHFIDLDLTDYKTGKPIKLSKVINGKVALIDFWASWCGPCRREIPNIAEIHKKYGGKDFVVISLNVWDKPDAQAKAIKDLGMTWTQLTDATRNATDTYGVDGIPQILLIGKDGVIIARDLRGEKIEEAVKKALGR